MRTFIFFSVIALGVSGALNLVSAGCVYHFDAPLHYEVWMLAMVVVSVFGILKGAVDGTVGGTDEFAMYGVGCSVFAWPATSLASDMGDPAMWCGAILALCWIIACASARCAAIAAERSVPWTFAVCGIVFLATGGSAVLTTSLASLLAGAMVAFGAMVVVLLIGYFVLAPPDRPCIGGLPESA